MKPASPAKLAERDITRTVKEFMELHGWRPVRINAGPFGKSGMPDFLFLHYGNRWILWVEFKAPGRSPASHQRAWIDAERKRGAAVVVVDDIDEFIAWYERQYGRAIQPRLFQEAL
jgi:hypothetical protein